ncbi:MAG TPA: methylenetetrahydrofolate reductase C-terminal domain-containing protein [Tepidisphaeraceae bacterium]|jgi:methylenetetrahydrofolate reductase (NADPH)
MFEKTAARFEALVKGMVFDCRSCGQCVLRQTGLICPMTCPKGLRNGPCGGTLNGECEVYPDKPCVWVRIHNRTGKESLATPNLLPSPDARLFHTSSYANYWTGDDKAGRTPLEYLDLGVNRTIRPLETASRLEARLKAGFFVRTCEVRAPRSAKLDTLRHQTKDIGDGFDAVNATAYLNAKPSLPSAVVAAKLAELGFDSICQSTCRDHTKTSFVSELIQNQMNGVHNTLCLTGDSYAGVPKIKQVFDMDASLMLYEARYLRERGIVHFTGEKLEPRPRIFLGGAINPFTNPANVPVRRLKQKVAAGVDFIQSQLVFDVPRFGQFMELVRQEQVDHDVFIIAGVPVVTSAKALAMLPKIPGVYLPDAMMRRLSGAADLKREGVIVAGEIARQLYEIPGVAGVHLMLFGPDHAVLPEVIDDLPRRRIGFPQTHLQQERELCPSTI